MAFVAPRHSWAAYVPTSADWDGLSDLVELAKDEAGAANVVVAGSMDYSALKPEDGIVLLHPESALDVESLSRFLREGGRVAVFDDFGSGDDLLRHFSIQRIPLPANPALELRKNPALAIAEPAEGPHPVMHGVARVVLNHASGVAHRELSPLLCVRSEEDGEKINVALAGAVEKGHLLVVGDSSVPINGMLRFPGNKTFTRNVLHYVLDTKDVPQKATGTAPKLYLLVGAFEQKGSYGDDSEGSTMGKLHAIVDFFRAFRRDGLPPYVTYLLCFLVLGGLVAWVVSRAAGLHRPVSPRYVKAIPVAAQGGVAGHAAIVAARGTTRALAALEIKSAVEEELCAALDVEHPPAPDELVRRARAAGLVSDTTARSLRSLLTYLGQVETLVLSRRAEAMRRVRDADIVRCSKTARTVLDEVRAARNSTMKGDPPLPAQV
ncbi:MAG TPA: DUF4350 domain-containing protein [Polyangiaceae bacterium]|nr:DUF4350 domain-containing protein [Polyangiaceae bacterium]